jgi:peptide deformylase
MVKIIQEGHPVLRQKAKKVLIRDISSKEIQDVIKKMKDALHKEWDGVAIAAPQIGVSLRIFVVAGMIFDEYFIRREKFPDGYVTPHPDLVYINPEITKISKTKKWMKEGCLSVRPLYGEVRRSTHATVRAYDEHGKAFVRGAGGLLAHIYQHETDHLDGILFIDHARDVHALNREK